MMMGFPVLWLHLLDFVAQSTPVVEWDRDLVAVDAFCGEAQILKAFSAAGHKVANFDVSQGNDGDILDMWGLCSIIKKVLKIMPYGILVGGPPCGSWVFINKATSRRSPRRIFGDCSRPYIRAANTITTRWILLAVICVARSVEWLTEQPRGSLMPACPYVTFLAMVVKPSFWGRVSFLMGAYQSRTPKPTLCFGTPPWLPRLVRKMTENDKKRVAKNKRDTAKAMVIKTVNKRGRVTVTGGPGMTASAAYTKRFARAIAKHHLNFMTNARAAGYTPPGPTAELEGVKAPFRWRHARMVEIRNFLHDRVADGSYVPVLEEGL